MREQGPKSVLEKNLPRRAVLGGMVAATVALVGSVVFGFTRRNGGEVADKRALASDPTTNPEPSVISKPIAPATREAAIPTPEDLKPLPEVTSLESLQEAGIGIVEWTSEQIAQAQQETGSLKIPVAGKHLEDGGSIVVAEGNPQGNTGFFFTLNKESEFHFPNLVTGEVVMVRELNPAITQVLVRSGNLLVGYYTATTHSVLAKEGDVVQPTELLFSGMFSPDEETQKIFNAVGNKPENTVVVIMFGEGTDLTDIQVGNLTLEDILREANGAVVAAASSN